MLYPELGDKAVVTIMGACAQELYDLGHRENFFYLQHAMGLASSIGLGLALHLPREKVVVLDGDGSVLMNLGTLRDAGALPAGESRARHFRQWQPALDRGLRFAHGVGGHRSGSHCARRRYRARRRSRLGGRIRRGGDRRVRAKRPQRDRCQSRRRGPESLRDGFASSGKRLSVQAMDCRTDIDAGEAMSSVLTQLVEELNRGTLRVVDLTQPLGPSTPGDRPAADVRALARRDHRRHLEVRRWRPGVVLEHDPDGRAHRHAFRRAHPLDHRQGSSGQRLRHDSGVAIHRACVRD